MDDVLATATKSLAEIITTNGVVNRDFKDVEAVMKDGGGAIMSVGYGTGEKRLLKAMNEALNSPLLNKVDMSKIRRLLYVIYSCKDNPVLVTETTEINSFMDGLSENMEVWWGLYTDESLGDQVKVSLIATGFDKDIPMENDHKTDKSQIIDELKMFYYPQKKQSTNNSTTEDYEKNEENDCLDENPFSDDSLSSVQASNTDECDNDKARSWYDKLKALITKLIQE